MSQRADCRRSHSSSKLDRYPAWHDVVLLSSLPLFFLLDLCCPVTWSVSRLYLVSVLVALHRSNRAITWAITGAAIFLTLVRPLFAATGFDWQQLFLTRILDLLLLVVTAWMGSRLFSKVNGTRSAQPDDRQLNEQELRLQGISNNLPFGAIYQLQRWPDNQRKFIHLSRGLEDALGISIDEIYVDPNTFFSHVPAEDLVQMDLMGRASAINSTPFDCEFRFVTKQGEVRWLELHSTPRHQPDQSVIWDGVILDFTKRRRRKNVLVAQNRVMRSIVTGEALNDTLEHVVSVVEEQIPGAICSIMLLDETNHTLKFSAGKKLAPEFVQRLDGFQVGESMGTCGAAAFLGQPVLSQIPDDPRWNGYHELAARHDLRTCWSIPIFGDFPANGTNKRNSVLGTFAIYMKKIWNPDPEAGAIVETATDLAKVAIERAAIFRSLCDSEERYRELVELSPEAVAIIQDGRFVYGNQHSARMLHFPAGQTLTGQRVEDFIHPDDVSSLMERHQRIREGAESVEPRLFHVKRYDGTWSCVESCAGPCRFNGKPGIQVVARDVTDRIEAEMQLRSSQQRFAMIFHASPVGICITSLKTGDVIDINETFLRIMGANREEVVGDITTHFSAWQSFEHRQQMLNELLEKGSLQNWEHTFKRKDGTIGTSIRNLERVELDGHECILTLFTDITDRKKLEDELRNSRQRLESLSRQLIVAQETERGILARELHDELGQDLATVKMSLQQRQAKSESLAPTELAESIALVERAIHQVRTLSLRLRPLQLDQLGLEAALHWLVNQQSAIGGFQGRLQIDLQDFVVPTKLATACFRVTQESLTNAIRHASPTTIEVKLARNQESIVLTIHDDGCGFDVESAGQRSRDGAVLGLSSMQERVSLVGGQLTINSIIDRGTTITAKMPIVERNDPQPKIGPPEIETTDALTRV